MKNMIFPVFIIVILFAACQPEVSFLKAKEQVSLKEFYKNNSATVQNYSISNTSGGIASTKRGIKIYFPANGFVTQAGAPVTGNFEVAVKEILTPYDMILNNMPTTSGGLPLESGGEFEIKVARNGQALKLAPGNFLRISIPDRPGVSMSAMQVFNGQRDADGNVDWVLNTDPGNFVVRDSTLFSNSTLFADSVNWINCDKFINEPTVNFSVYPLNAPSNDSTNVFVHLTGRNSVVKMNWTQGLSYFKSDKLLAVPSTIVGISVRNGKLFASLVPVNVQAGQSVNLNFIPYTETQLKAKLAQLQ